MLLAWRMWGHIILFSLLALPVALLTAYLIGRQRASSGIRHPFRTPLADALSVTGTLPWLWMILTPGNVREPARSLSLTPFRDLATLAEGFTGTLIAQVGGNLLVFATLGAMLPIRSPALARLSRVAAVAAGSSLIVESLQYALGLHRVSSIDDILLNTTGAVLAAIMTMRWWAQPIPEGTVPR
ncbi:hypothetical protein Aph01nite_20040 [Acrocarpospora phusangensis]|uniref:VanZ-like domain-containing protein n=1 Tax=Acrocarpospora phusangensis TaxID=1070424 RepID=A0A919Q9J8_9ACTN|nr:VanZ family protein [Acrocarpospora phusangensis]GIH23694.1 hypothetical protein Aph01nite_20040 [Acrocarpospora phusangensis]